MAGSLHGSMLDRIHITNLEIPGILGINPDERVNPQPIRVSVTMWVDTSKAASSDDIADAANYRTVSKAIIAHIEQGSPQLVERLVQEIADVCLDTEPLAVEVEVTVEKPAALRHAESVGIRIRRGR